MRIRAVPKTISQWFLVESQKFLSHQGDYVRFLPFRVDEFQPHFCPDRSAHDVEARRQAFAGDGNAVDTLDEDAALLELGCEPGPMTFQALDPSVEMVRTRYAI